MLFFIDYEEYSLQLKKQDIVIRNCLGNKHSFILYFNKHKYRPHLVVYQVSFTFAFYPVIHVLRTLY